MRELETERLRLRYIDKNDAAKIFYGWANDPEVTEYLTWDFHKDILETNFVLAIWIEEYKNENSFRWGIERKEDGALIGMIDVVRFDGKENSVPVIGYCSGKKYWGNGYMTEACKAVVGELFECGYPTILISAAAENIGSNRVIQKCGFRFVESRQEVLKNKTLTVNHYRIDK